MAEISFFSEDIKFSLSNQKEVKSWLIFLVKNEGEHLSDLNIVFVSDERLLEMNREFLGHDYYTDILTFPGDTPGVSGELYISIDRVRENAAERSVDFQDEVHRVMAHGVLHLLGYNDKNDEEIKTMREREVFYLNLRSF